MTESEEIKWDLSIIFENNEVANEFIESTSNEMRHFQKENKNQVNRGNITAKELHLFLEMFNTLFTKLDLIRYFAYNQLAVDQSVKESLELMNTAENLQTKGKIIIASFEIELGKLIEKREELIDDPQLNEYKHYLEKLKRKTQYMLSENEEQLILEKDRYSKLGWEKLQSEWLSSRIFTIMDEGIEITISWGEYWKYIRSSNRETRKNAIFNMVGENGLAKDKELYAAALRNICGDHLLTSKRRNHPTSVTSSLIKNDLTPEMLENLLEVLQDNVHLFQDFLLLKAKIMGTEKLLGEDLWAPIPILSADSIKYSWESAKEIVIKVFGEFDEEFGSIAQKMFNENHVDASPRKGKVTGAYSSTHDYFKESFILMSYNETISDVLTLAHEMGHSVHGYLSINEQKYLNNQYSGCIAETASEFGRFMVVDNLKENTDNEMIKKFILFNHLEELAASIFEVGSRFFFEKSLYEAIDTGEYLDHERVCKLFDKARRQFFGDAIEFLSEQSYDWTWKPHYYIAQLRYYNYPYVFGELLVMALYNKYKKEGKTFISKFKASLSAGGSKSPLDLGKDMGVDLETKDFWQMGFDEFKTVLDETKKLF